MGSLFQLRQYSKSSIITLIFGVSKRTNLQLCHLTKRLFYCCNLFTHLEEFMMKKNCTSLSFILEFILGLDPIGLQCICSCDTFLPSS
jgi:hypothetical protein